MKINSSDVIKRLKEKKKRRRAPISFSISEPTYLAFKTKCAKNGLTASSVVQELMEAFVES